MTIKHRNGDKMEVQQRIVINSQMQVKEWQASMRATISG